MTYRMFFLLALTAKSQLIVTKLFVYPLKIYPLTFSFMNPLFYISFLCTSYISSLYIFICVVSYIPHSTCSRLYIILYMYISCLTCLSLQILLNTLSFIYLAQHILLIYLALHVLLYIYLAHIIQICSGITRG